MKVKLTVPGGWGFRAFTTECEKILENENIKIIEFSFNNIPFNVRRSDFDADRMKEYYDLACIYG